MLWVRIQLRRGVLDTTLCDIVCQWFATGRWFSLSTPVSSTNKTDRHDIAEIWLRGALNIILLYRIQLAMSRIQVLSMDYYAVLMGTIHFSLLIVFLDI